MRNRDAHYARARRTQDLDAWNIARFLRNRVTSAIAKYKAEKIKDDLNRNYNNPKRFWHKIREILPNSNCATAAINTLYDPDNKAEIDKERLPDYINKYFSGIGSILAQRHLTRYPHYYAGPYEHGGNLHALDQCFSTIFTS